MKKVYGIIFTILLLVTGLYIINKPKAQTTYPGSGTELSATVPEDGLTVIQDSKEITVRSDGSENLDDYAVALRQASLQLKIRMNVNIPNGTTLKKGDYFEIPLRRFSSDGRPNITLNTTTWGDLKDSSGTIIGQWQITNNSIQVVLNEKVDGKNSLSTIEVSTSEQGGLAYGSAKDRIGKIQVGNITFTYKIRKVSLNKGSERAKGASGGVSNNRIIWHIKSNGALNDKLYNTGGREGEFVDTLIEDTIKGATEVTINGVANRFYVPMSIDGGGMSSMNVFDVQLLSHFTEIKQADSETYQEFKTRIMANPLQYGIYKKDDEHTFIIYYGKVGKDTPLLTASNINNAITRIIATGNYAESDRTALTQAYTDAFLNGITEGHASKMIVGISVFYPKANMERTVTNTAKITYDGVTNDVTGTTKLAPTAGSGETTESSVTVTKKAQDTGAVLKGAKLKLQFKDGTDWVDYYINNKLEETTNDNGQVTFNNLAVGTYKVVETEAPKRYKSGATSEEFEVRSGSSSNIQIELLNEVATHTITTHHYKQGTTESLGESKTETKEYGQEYTTNPLSNIPEGYELVGTPSNASGTVEKDEIVIYEYKLKDVELTIRYVDENGNEISSIKEPHKYGDSYTTSPMENDEYELVSTPSNANGTITDNTTVTYTYKKKEVLPQTGTITVKYVDEEGNEVSSSEISTKEVGTTYTSKPKEIEGYVIKEKPSTESYTYTKEGQTVTYTYERIRLKVSTKVRNNIGGNIEGDEEVLYGENSTAGKIHIKANQGYVINKVYINGSEIEIPKDSTELNISNFIKMNEDKEVEVEFKEIKKDLIVKVPPTSAQTMYTILGMLGLISVGVFGIYYKKKLS